MGFMDDSFTIFKREMLIFKSNLRANIIRSIMFPLIIIVFLGNLGFAVTQTPVAIVNYANNPASLSFISALQAHGTLNILAITGQNAAISMLKNGQVQLVIVVLSDFPSKSTTSPGVYVYYSNTQITAVNAALPFIQSTAAEFLSGVQANQQSYLQPQQSKSVITSQPLYAAEGSYRDFLTGGVISMVVVFGSLFGGGFSLLSDKQLGNIKAFLITPINKNAIVVGKIFSGLMSSLLYAFLALGIGVLSGVSVAMGLASVIYLVPVVFILGIAFNAFAIIVASKVNKVEIFAIVSQAVGMPLWFLSGGLVPISSLPSWMQPVALINPLTYANDITRSVILAGFVQPGSALVDFAVISVFAVIMVALSFMTFKSTLE